jgi:hypothetical protein
MTERFTQAIEQLGSDKLEIKLGGIYSLERTAQEEKNYHWPVMEVLTSYVRRHAARKPDKESRENAATPPDPDSQAAVPPEHDIQAIMDVIGQRSEYYRTDEQVEYGTIDLRNTNLQGANLEAAHLHRANLRGANLQRAILIGANLTGAHGITEYQLELTLGSNETELPEDLNRPEWWGKSIEEQVRLFREPYGG